MQDSWDAYEQGEQEKQDIYEEKNAQERLEAQEARELDNAQRESGEDREDAEGLGSPRESPQSAQIVPSEDQQRALTSIRAWLNAAFEGEANQTFAMGGLAGTGKTTIIKLLLQDSRWNPSIMALAGKAAKVLRSKGMDANTIHSNIYRKVPGLKDLNWEAKPPDEVEGDYFIVDEASMVNRIILQDLKSYQRPILFVGDHGQLEPIGDDPYLMQSPDVRLEKIHRQAENSEIVKAAHKMRMGEPLAYGTFRGSDEVTIQEKETYTGLINWNPSIIICGFNDTRHTLNGMVRQVRGLKGLLDVGDQIICLENNRDFGVFNGEMATVIEKPTMKGNTIRAMIRLDDGRECELPMCASQFGSSERLVVNRKAMTRWDWGFAITCHKSQGSEWKRVAVLEQLVDKWDARRWSYTAMTRASSTCLYVTKRGING